LTRIKAATAAANGLVTRNSRAASFAATDGLVSALLFFISAVGAGRILSCATVVGIFFLHIFLLYGL
jgi:hypothetical protein